VTSDDQVGRHVAPRTGPFWRAALPHVVGLAWVVGSAVLVLVPALHHGLSLGPYDLLSKSGLTQASAVRVRNSSTGDQIAEMIPWSNLAWLQVHQGHLPLWNPFSGLGLPLAFNWQSGVFSLPVVIGYAFPLHLAYTVQIIVTMVIAGIGAYVLARVLHVGVIGCATAGTVFELSGSFMGWLGYPHASVMAWAGWLLAVAILIVRGDHRVRNITLFAVITALAVYAGQPEILTMVVASALVVVVTMVVIGAITRESVHRPLVDLVLGIGAGAALGAPLLLPGLQVLAGSTRNSGTLVAATEVGKSLPPHDLLHLLVQGYNGLPIAGSHVFGDAVYFDTAAYVGVVAVALAVVGVIRGWRRSDIAAIAVLAVVTTVIVFAPPVEALFLHLPQIQTIDWHRDLMMLGLCTAVLAGVGIDAVAHSVDERSTSLWLGGLLAAFFVLLLALLAFGSSGLPFVEATLRRQSLIWPLVTTGLALAIVGGRAAWTRRPGSPRSVKPTRRSAGSVAAGLLLLVETAFLIASGAPLWSSSAHGITTPSPVSTLARTVGSATVGVDAFTCFDGPSTTALGILPEANILYGIHEFDFYDPILPRTYVRAWAGVSHTGAGVPVFNSFCPQLMTATQARRFGVQYVLVSHGAVGPKDAVFVRTVGGEDLYRIPGSSDATVTPVTPEGGLPPVDAVGTAVEVHHPSPSSWEVVTTGQSDQVLRLRLTDQPGWHATIDGRPLAISSYADVMIQARIPAGHHVIELSYWPPLFTAGLIVAGCCLVMLVAASIVARSRRRSRVPVHSRRGEGRSATGPRTDSGGAPRESETADESATVPQRARPAR
jgi:hypothetical protein